MEGSIFKTNGFVTRKFKTEKFASITVEYSRKTPQGSFKSFQECVAFDIMVIRQIETIGQGEGVSITGEIGSKRLENKDKSPVLQNGYKLFVPQFVINKIESAGPVEPKSDEPPSDDEIPF